MLGYLTLGLSVSLLYYPSLAAAKTYCKRGKALNFDSIFRGAMLADSLRHTSAESDPGSDFEEGAEARSRDRPLPDSHPYCLN